MGSEAIGNLTICRILGVCTIEKTLPANTPLWFASSRTLRSVSQQIGQIITRQDASQEFNFELQIFPVYCNWTEGNGVQLQWFRLCGPSCSLFDVVPREPLRMAVVWITSIRCAQQTAKDSNIQWKHFRDLIRVQNLSRSKVSDAPLIKFCSWPNLSDWKGAGYVHVVARPTISSPSYVCKKKGMDFTACALNELPQGIQEQIQTPSQSQSKTKVIWAILYAVLPRLILLCVICVLYRTLPTDSDG